MGINVEVTSQGGESPGGGGTPLGLVAQSDSVLFPSSFTDDGDSVSFESTLSSPSPQTSIVPDGTNTVFTVEAGSYAVNVSFYGGTTEGPADFDLAVVATGALGDVSGVSRTRLEDAVNTYANASALFVFAAEGDISVNFSAQDDAALSVPYSLNIGTLTIVKIA